MAPVLKQKRTHKKTAAQDVVARLDSYSEDEHQAKLEAARTRVDARRARARAAAARVRNA